MEYIQFGMCTNVVVGALTAAIYPWSIDTLDTNTYWHSDVFYSPYGELKKKVWLWEMIEWFMKSAATFLLPAMHNKHRRHRDLSTAILRAVLLCLAASLAGYESVTCRNPCNPVGPYSKPPQPFHQWVFVQVFHQATRNRIWIGLWKPNQVVSPILSRKWNCLELLPFAFPISAIFFLDVLKCWNLEDEALHMPWHFTLLSAFARVKFCGTTTNVASVSRIFLLRYIYLKRT